MSWRRECAELWLELAALRWAHDDPVGATRAEGNAWALTLAEEIKERNRALATIAAMPQPLVLPGHRGDGEP